MSIFFWSSDSSSTALAAYSSKGYCTSLSHCCAKFLSSICKLVTVALLSYTTRHLLSPSSADLGRALVWIRGKFLRCRRDKSAYRVPWVRNLVHGLNNCINNLVVNIDLIGLFWITEAFILGQVSWQDSPFSEAVQPPLPNLVHPAPLAFHLLSGQNSQLHLWQQGNLLLSLSVNLVLWWLFYVLRGCPFLRSVGILIVVSWSQISGEITELLAQFHIWVSNLSILWLCFVHLMQVSSVSLRQRVRTALQQKGHHEVCQSFRKLSSGHHVWPTILSLQLVKCVCASCPGSRSPTHSPLYMIPWWIQQCCSAGQIVNHFQWHYGWYRTTWG